ncbi:MAG: hypothetical protein DRO36_01600 [Candidatus Hecatellales archaeon]|nr:MAG: hypothetical protein DRO36_01600 [Candidatus Hecatellales archaeon]
MGKIASGVKCSVLGCNSEAVKSVSVEKAKAGGLNVSGEKRVYLCKTHYKQLKKNLKKEKLIEKWRYMG